MKKSTFFIFIVLVAGLAISCKKSCNLSPKEGYVIVGDDKDCYYEQIEYPTPLDLKINDFTDLKNKLVKITKELADGKTINLEMMGQLVVIKLNFTTLNEFGALQKSYGDKLTIVWNGNHICPAKSGIMLTYGEWCEWNKLPFGANNSSGGTKSGELFVIPANQTENFEKEGQGEGSFVKGAPVIDINTRADLHAVPAQIITLAAMYPGDKPQIQFCTDLSLDRGDDISAIESLTIGQPLKDKFGFYETQVKQSWANDSVPVSCASVLYVMNNHNLLENAPLGGGKHAFIKYVGPNSLDSVPNTQFVGIPQRNSDQLNWSKFAPSRIDIVHAWNVGTSISQEIYNKWARNIVLVPAERTELPGGVQGVVGVNDAFLDYLSEPAGDAKSGVSFKLVVKGQDLVLGEYGLPPPAPGINSLNVSHIDFGCGNSSGPKMEASWLAVAEGHEDPNNPGTILWDYMNTQYNNEVLLNVQTNDNKYMASDGKIILGSEWWRFQLTEIGGWGGAYQKPKLVLPPCKLYLNDENMIGAWNYCLEHFPYSGPLKAFCEMLGIDSTKVDIILELPPGKEAFGVWGQVNNAPKRGGVSTTLNGLLPKQGKR